MSPVLSFFWKFKPSFIRSLFMEFVNFFIKMKIYIEVIDLNTIEIILII